MNNLIIIDYSSHEYLSVIVKYLEKCSFFKKKKKTGGNYTAQVPLIYSHEYLSLIVKYLKKKSGGNYRA